MKRTLLALVFLAACGGGPSTDPVTATTAESYCQQACEHDVACNGEDLEVCTSECVTGVAGWVREDALADVSACQADLACTGDTDTCTDECAPTSAHESFETACRDSLAGCDVGTTQLDEICETTPDSANDVGFLCLAAPAIMNELTACFTDPETGCATYQECLQAVLEDHGITG